MAARKRKARALDEQIEEVKEAGARGKRACQTYFLLLELISRDSC
jgi:hypothetical protein